MPWGRWPLYRTRGEPSVATIAGQTISGFEDGGFNNPEYQKPKGYVRRPTLFLNSDSGRPFIAGEKYKSEYIISSEQLKDPVIADFVSMMESRRGIARFEAGGYSNSAASSSNTSQVISGGADVSELKDMIMQLIHAIQLVDSKEVTLPLNKLEERQNERQIAIQNQTA